METPSIRYRYIESGTFDVESCVPVTTMHPDSDGLFQLPVGSLTVFDKNLPHLNDIVGTVPSNVVFTLTVSAITRHTYSVLGTVLRTLHSLQYWD